MRWLLLFAACSYPPPAATEADAQRAPLGQLGERDVRALLIEKCSGDGGCHRTPLPQDARAAEWPDFVDDMTERSKIDSRQKKLITQYLVVMAK